MLTWGFVWLCRYSNNIDEAGVSSFNLNGSVWKDVHFFCRVILVKALWASDRWIKSVFQTANSVLCLSKGTGDVWWQRGACFASSITPNVVLVTGCLLQCICQNVSLVSDEYNIFCASINVDWMSFTPPFPLLHLLYQSLWHILLDLTEIAVSLCLFWESYG